MSYNGVRSPAAPSTASRSSAPSPIRPKFDAPLLKTYMKKLLASTLNNTIWPDFKDKDKVRLWCREIGERVKERAIEIEPKGFKYMVTTQINENLGQGGRADLVCHWEDSDTVAQEVFANTDTILRQQTEIETELHHCVNDSEMSPYLATSMLAD